MARKHEFTNPARRGLRALAWILLLFAFAPAVATASELQCPVMEVFVRDGCPHCAEAKVFLSRLQRQYADLSIVEYEVGADLDARRRLLDLSRQNGVDPPGVPSFLICGEFYAGFSSTAGSEDWIESRLTGRPAAAGTDTIDTPVGELSVGELGLPLFTVALGLIDGFNPCAMWVLLFLLSILVNIRSRRRILLVAGTFVLVSGLVYFAFMAAWLNLFLLVGLVRWLQVALGLLALGIGAVHIKDFFAFGRGLTLGIGDSVKPTLYARVRNVLHAETLWAALIGVTVVAVMVNLVELLCTAGIPALYTQLLTLRQMPTLDYYGYLALYNLAYVFDDAPMVAIAVFTLNKFKLQQRQGRWLKLLSGVVVAGLGLLLLAAPRAMF